LSVIAAISIAQRIHTSKYRIFISAQCAKIISAQYRFRKLKNNFVNAIISVKNHQNFCCNIGAFLILICNPEENYVTKPHLKDPIIGVLENTSHGNL